MSLNNHRDIRVVSSFCWGKGELFKVDFVRKGGRSDSQVRALHDRCQVHYQGSAIRDLMIIVGNGFGSFLKQS